MAKQVNKKKEQKSEGIAKYIFIAVLIIIAGYFIYDNFIKKDESEFTISSDPTERFKNIKEPQFVKEGEVEFLKNDGKSIIKKIDLSKPDEFMVSKNYKQVSIEYRWYDHKSGEPFIRQ